eukprot:5653313-Prymnesium_polylepis.1
MRGGVGHVHGRASDRTGHDARGHEASRANRSHRTAGVIRRGARGHEASRPGHRPSRRNARRR